MKNLLTITGVLVLGLLSATAPVFAHHGVAAYDNAKKTTLTGTVTQFKFINPHCELFFDVKDADGNIQHWSMEAPPPSMMKHSAGWYKDMVKPGDSVQVTLNAARNGAFVGKGRVDLINGKAIPAYSEEDGPSFAP
jgi:hypothetical protein